MRRTIEERETRPRKAARVPLPPKPAPQGIEPRIKLRIAHLYGFNSWEEYMASTDLK